MLWQIPLAVVAIIAFFRALVAPAAMVEEQRRRRKVLATKLRDRRADCRKQDFELQSVRAALTEAECSLSDSDQKLRTTLVRLAAITAEKARPRVHAVLDWRGGHSGCYEPFVLRNISDAPAQKVRIGGIVGGDGKQATFPFVGYIGAKADAQVWPEIENADTRNGHPDFAAFMWAAQLGEAWDVCRTSDAAQMKTAFRKGTVLPFEITYFDLDGKQWRTHSQVRIGGEAGTGNIVVETLGFDDAAVTLIESDSGLHAENARLRREGDELRPRSLTTDQRATIAAGLVALCEQERLRGSAPHIHVLAGEGPDCGYFARQFAEVFMSAGVRVDRHSPPYDRDDDFFYGLWIRWDPEWRNKHEFLHDGPVFAQALRSAGVDVEVVERRGSFTSLIVGSRNL